MKPFIFLFFASFFFILQTPQESPDLKEANALTEAASKLFNEGKYDEALAKTKKAFEIQERLLPHTDSRIVTSLIYLGDIYTAKRDYDDARKALERAQEIQAAQSSPDNVTLTSTWDRLAVVYYRKGDERKAEELFQRALTVREKAFGPQHERVAYALFAMGEFYRVTKNFERAAPNYKRALSIYGKLSGIKSNDFERTSDGFICLGFESEKQENALKELTEIRKQFAPDPAEAEVPLLNGKALIMPKPHYPREARERRLSGIVVVKLRIDESGNVIDAHDMCQGPPYLSAASVDAARLARFAPTLVAGKPVKVTGVMRYKYVAQ